MQNYNGKVFLTSKQNFRLFIQEKREKEREQEKEKVRLLKNFGLKVVKAEGICLAPEQV